MSCSTLMFHMAVDGTKVHITHDQRMVTWGWTAEERRGSKAAKPAELTCRDRHQAAGCASLLLPFFSSFLFSVHLLLSAHCYASLSQCGISMKACRATTLEARLLIELHSRRRGLDPRSALRSTFCACKTFQHSYSASGEILLRRLVIKHSISST